MRFRWVTVVFALAMLAHQPGHSDQYQTWLQDGEHVTIDATTNRVMRGNQPDTPLWDGVHRLYDGSVMIIKNGVVISGKVPRPGADPAATNEAETADEYTTSPCIELSVMACGFNGECKDTADCLTARQLVNLELEEQVRQLNALGESTQQQCQRLLHDRSQINRCDSGASTERETPCSQLRTHVCGINGSCAESDACSAARQLLAMEAEELAQTRHRGRLTHSSLQCLEAVRNESFFSQCNAPAE